ncbi:MAG: ferritin-like domain-containing protein [Patiriisocius sp.]|uniref:ferritin-like domain-containing protein n=1 Tax=Patiriisocius sp. TaxID=2822396 RepID=UPI003EF4B950
MEATEQHKKLKNALQELLEKNYDAEKGFKQVMKKAENPQLKIWLQNQAAQRSQFASQIDSELRKINETPDSDGSVSGSVHRMWIDIKTALSFDKDESILEECIRGEKASVDEYQYQLEKTYLNQSVRNMLSEQKSKVEDSLATVKRMEDLID